MSHFAVAVELIVDLGTIFNGSVFGGFRSLIPATTVPIQMTTFKTHVDRWMNIRLFQMACIFANVTNPCLYSANGRWFR
jgi:hypothetical protein